MQAAAAFGFDGIKVDGCGNEPNITAWAVAANATGRPLMLGAPLLLLLPVPRDRVGPQRIRPSPRTAENCNDNYPFRPPSFDACPYNYYRTSIDNAPPFLSAVSNLLDTAQFLATQARRTPPPL